MNKRLIAILAIVAVLAVALVVWQQRRSGKAPDKSTEDASAKMRTDIAPEASAGDQGSKLPQIPSELVLDDDPKGPLRLEGQVIDADEEPVSGAIVTLSSNPPRTVKTESDGSFAFTELVPRTYSVIARKDDLVGGPVIQELTDKSEPVVIRVATGATLEVTVVDEKSAPLAGVKVELREIAPRQETTDKDGKARFRGVSGGFLALVASAPGFGVTHQPVQVPDMVGARVEARIVLRKGARVAGKVVKDGGKPVEGARVVAFEASAMFAIQDVRLDGVATDAQGRFELPPQSAGTYRFTAFHADHAPSSTEPITLDGVTEVSNIEIVLAEGGTLAGKVVDSSGQPVPFAGVRVVNKKSMGFFWDAGSRVRTAIAGEQGEFHVKGLSRAELMVMAETKSATSEIVTVDLGQVSEKSDVVLTLSITGKIAGMVVNSAGEPVAEVQVSAYPDFWSGENMDDFILRGGTGAEITDGGGHFVFEGLRQGKYRLQASRSAMRNLAYAQPGVQATTGDMNVKLVVDAPGSVKGTVQFEDGSTPELFTVTVGFPPGMPVASGKGTFSVENVPPGKYDVAFHGPSFASRTVRDVEVVAGQVKDLGTIKVKRGRHVSGRVLGAGGRPVAGATVIAARQLVGDGKSITANIGMGGEEFFGVRRTTSADDGSFQISGIGVTELMLVAEHDAHGRSLPVSIPAGTASMSHDLELRGFGSLAGKVTAGSEPAVRAMVIATPRGSRQMVMVQTGDDGGYVFDRLPAGSHHITASLMGGSLGSSSAAGKEVDIVAGQKARADIVIEQGDIELKVVVKGKDGAAIDAFQAFLMKGQINAGNAKELTDMFLQAAQSGAQQTLAVATDTATFSRLTAAQYSVCVLPINGNMSDMSFQMRLQEHANELKVYCQAKTVAESPKQQTHSAVVPPMEPLPADPDGAPPAP